MAASGLLPSPKVFLDPLTDLESCYYYVVPKYWAANHANTRWFISMIRNNRLDKISRKMELQPKTFNSTYFQLLDNPRLHSPDDPSAHALFHKKAVLYLGALGLAMYFKNADMVQIMLECRDPRGELICDVNEAQYATHIQDPIGGDFQAYPCPVVMLRSGFYYYIGDMIKAGWNPHSPICMPARRPFERRALYYLDWLDYMLYLLQDRPMLPLANLVNKITSDPLLYTYKRLPLEVIRPPTEDDRIRTGIVEFEQLPTEAQIIGIKSLWDIAVNYSVYLQSKKRYEMVRNCYREMVEKGINPELMMAHAQDFDAASDYKEPDTVQPTATTTLNSNASLQSNNAAASGSSKKKANLQNEETAYLSEPTRLLLHALNINNKGSNKIALLSLLDAVAVYVRRNFFVIIQPIDGNKGQNPAQDSQLIFQKRDARNAIVILMNLLHQEYLKVETIKKAMKEKTQGKFKHVDSSKQASNKLATLTRNVKSIANLLFQILLHTREIVKFIRISYPPYTYSDRGGDVDFALNPELEPRFKGIQMGVCSELSLCQTAVNYMTMSDIKKAASIKELSLNMRLGKMPSQDKTDNLKASAHGGKKRGNSSNANDNAFVSMQPTPGQWTNSEDALQFLFNSGKEITRQSVRAGHVTFVKVKRKPTPALAGKSQAKDGGDDSINPAAYKSTEDEAESKIGEDVAARLTEQINQLRQSPDKANVALAGIYQRMLDDLMTRMDAGAKVVLINSDSEAKSEISDEDKEYQDKTAALNNFSGQDSEGSEQPTTKCDGEEAAEEVSVKATSCARRYRVSKRVGSGRHSGGSGVGSHRRGHHKKAGGYQKARVYEAAPEGTEFDLS